MKRFVLCLAALMLPVAALAVQDDNAQLNVVVTAPSYSGCADPIYDWIDAGVCTDLVGEPIAGFSFAWVVHSDGDGYPNGIGGVQFGIVYDAGVTGWTLCTGGQEVPEAGWPESGTGNACTWSGGCYNPAAGNAMVGFFALSDGANGSMAITVDPRTGEANYSDCEPVGYEFCSENLGYDEDFSDGTLPMCEDCPPTPVKDASWGQIKSLY
jgi:hypothetical protein